MKQIPLTQGMVALVDDEDFEWLCGWKWHARKTPIPGKVYAARSRGSGDVLLHSVIMGESPISGLTPDHKDGDGLNNQRANLRWANKEQQGQNSRVRSDNQSGFKGVSLAWDRTRPKPWQTRIRIHTKRVSLGYYTTPEEAAIAYNEAAKAHFGEFARLNQVTGGAA